MIRNRSINVLCVKYDSPSVLNPTNILPKSPQIFPSNLKLNTFSCSIACYKSHKPIHENEVSKTKPKTTAGITLKNDNSNDQNQDSSLAHTQPPIPQKTQGGIDFNNFQQDPDLLRLLSRYPKLRYQLQLIYGATLEPGPDEARSWNRVMKYSGGGFSRGNNGLGRNRGRGRGRGARGRGRGGGGGGGGGAAWHAATSTLEDESLRGPWTREKSDRMAVGIMQRMRQGDDEEETREMAEGLKEFVQLCQMKFERIIDR